MLDPNYVRENLESVRTALAARNFSPEVLNHFAELDAERRRVNSEADDVNHERNSASKEIGALMQAGKTEEATAKKASVAGLKERQAELEKLRDEADAAMHELLSGLPNLPAADVPVGADESANAS